MVQTKERRVGQRRDSRRRLRCVFAPCPQVPGAITTSAFGYRSTRHRSSTPTTDVLPSANFRFDLRRTWWTRLRRRARWHGRTTARSAARSPQTTRRIPATAATRILKPIRSTNLDATLEWYFQPRRCSPARSVLHGPHELRGFGVRDQSSCSTSVPARSTRTGSRRRPTAAAPVKGVELAWQQDLAYGFGIQANYTYADASETGGHALVGASQNTYNVIGYYENYGFSARLAWTYRSHFFVGLDRSTAEYQDDTGTLAASLGYKINDNFALTFDALNLNDPTLKYYGANTDQPRAFYKNGRQYYAGCASSSDAVCLATDSPSEGRGGAAHCSACLVSLMGDHRPLGVAAVGAHLRARRPQAGFLRVPARFARQPTASLAAPPGYGSHGLLALAACRPLPGTIVQAGCAVTLVTSVLLAGCANVAERYSARGAPRRSRNAIRLQSLQARSDQRWTRRPTRFRPRFAGH